MIRIVSTLGLAAALACAFAGCASTNPTPPDPTPTVVECKAAPGTGRSGPALVGQAYGMAMTPLPLNSVQFGSAALSRSVAVQKLYAERTPADMVQISARLVSCMDAPGVVRMRTTFMRADTAPAEAPSAWKVVHLEPRATALYSELSVTRDAASYLIEIAP